MTVKVTEMHLVLYRSNLISKLLLIKSMTKAEVYTGIDLHLHKLTQKKEKKGRPVFSFLKHS